MNAISIEVRQQLRDRRAALLRLAGTETASSADLQAQAACERREEAGILGADLVLQRLSEAHRRDVAQIDAALARIDDGTYGECVRCGHAIGRQRLRAIAEARLCIPCTSR